MLPTTTLTSSTAPTSAQLLAALPQALVATDLEGRVTWWAGAAESLYGWSATEAVGRQVGELIVPEPDRLDAAELRAQAVDGRPFTGPFNCAAGTAPSSPRSS